MVNSSSGPTSVGCGVRLHLLFDKFGHFHPCGEVWEFHPYLGSREYHWIQWKVLIQTAWYNGARNAKAWIGSRLPEPDPSSGAS